MVSYLESSCFFSDWHPNHGFDVIQESDFSICCYVFLHFCMENKGSGLEPVLNPY